jgi:hypothetical protein
MGQGGMAAQKRYQNGGMKPFEPRVGNKLELDLSDYELEDI